MLFEDNRGPSLSIDETALSNGELYTIVTNKEAKGGKKAIVAMLKGRQNRLWPYWNASRCLKGIG